MAKVFPDALGHTLSSLSNIGLTVYEASGNIHFPKGGSLRHVFG
jgi:hypothetical protein